MEEERQRVLRQLAFCGLGIVASGVVLVGFLVQGWRAAIRAEASLLRERELGRLYRGFVSVVSHQFRTPLAIIDSSAQRMARRGDAMNAEEIVARTGRIRDAARRLVRLMESTLNAARLEAGELTPNARECDLALLVAELCAVQAEAEPAACLDVKVDALPVLRCDPALVEQAVANLLSNAVKYSPPGSPVEVRGWTGPGGAAVLSIRDRGLGVPAEELPHLFGRFYRASNVQSMPGTGIGLAFARQVARLHDGDITVASRAGEGATFTLRLQSMPPAAALAAQAA
nr:HAMP domain-containing sensor histidine kinase [Pararoseomonas baculiformis]